jgi:hypothetical protein
MSNSVYKINRGIGKSIEFKGLKAQYIWYLGVGVVLLLMVFAVLYIAGVGLFVCAALVLTAGTVLVVKVYQLSDKYGEHGMMKAAAARKMPRVIRCGSRRMFYGKKENVRQPAARRRIR